MEKTDCCVCGSGRRFKIWSHCDDRFLQRLGIPGRVTFFVCRECGLGYADPRLGDIELDRLYTGTYRTEDVTPEHLDSKKRDSVERIGFLNRRGGIAPGAALEIGSSEGTLLKLLRDDGWQVTGCEPFAPYARFGIEHWQIDTRIAFFRSEDFSERYDLVVFVHVLEHIPEPTKFLDDVAKVLNHGGLVLVETPNLLNPYKNRIKRAMLPSPHLAIYSPEAVKNLFAKCGFEVLDVDEGLNMRVLARYDGRNRQVSAVGLRYGLGVARLYRTRGFLETAASLRSRLLSSITDSSRRLLSRRLYGLARAVYRKVFLY